MLNLRRLLALFSCLLAGVAQACPVPVFRYALERWDGDPFQLVVFYRGALDGRMDQRLRDLEPTMDEKQGARANCRVTRVDVDKPVPELWKSVWESQQKEALPRMVLCAPEWRKGDDPLWASPLDDAALTKATESPKRAELVAHLLKGTAVVWVIVETADQQANAELKAKVKEASDRLVNELVIPHMEPDGVDLRSPLPVEVSFATVVVKADDPSEGLLMRLLNNDAAFKEPTLFPVFGRARVLASLAGSKVNKDLLDETGRFLCSACSCQVKAQNPGFDLLVRSDWDSIFGDSQAPPPESKPQPARKPLYVPIPARPASR